MDRTPSCCGRREVLTGSGVLVVGALSACSSAADRAEGAASDNAAVTSAPTAATASSAPSASTASSPPADAAGSPVATTAEVPVGGGIVVPALQLVVTQPSEGEFRAFSSICTHEGCPVTKVEDGVIVCPCHGSQFDIDTGERVAGPARDPLAGRSVSVQGEDISVG